jgi:hypothetical protein
MLKRAAALFIFRIRQMLALSGDTALCFFTVFARHTAGYIRAE